MWRDSPDLRKIHSKYTNWSQGNLIVVGERELSRSFTLLKLWTPCLTLKQKFIIEACRFNSFMSLGWHFWYVQVTSFVNGDHDRLLRQKCTLQPIAMVRANQSGVSDTNQLIKANKT